MRLVLTFFLFSLTNAFAIDTGNGSDGTCDVIGAATTQITSAKKYYQCTSLNINGNLTDFKGGQAGGGGGPLVIKVQGDAVVSAGGTLDLSGQNGGNGNTVAIASGGLAGAGGFAGGSSTATNGANGSGAGAGTGGTFAPHTIGPNSVGGGGGGASYKTVAVATPTNGDNNGAPIAAGTNGSIYGPESNFDASFNGGSGGASGGSGVDNTSVTWFGSAGGGGGGAVRIIAGGNITVDGSIVSKGGDGGGAGTEASSGGGGGASGGAIWLQAAGTLTISNTGLITAIGGTNGTNATTFLGSGGAGGDGRIRLDSGSGAITNLGGTLTPAPYSSSFSPTINPLVSRQYMSTISCARVKDEIDLHIFINVFLGIIMACLGHLVVSRRGKV